jgi:hypothetical protein
MPTSMLVPLLATACVSPVPTQEATDGTAATPAPIRSVALFKNGLGFVRREARAARGARQVELRLPIPTHGTFTIASDPELVRLSSAVARAGQAADAVLALNLLELLRANLGREVELTLAEGQKVAGRLLSAGEPEPDWRDPYRYYYGGYPRQSDIVLLSTAEGSMALRGNDVQRVSARGAPLESHRSVPRALLDLAFDAPLERETPLAVTSLERGWSWAPSYTLDLAEGKARIEARAVVFDEVEDLDGATLQFVTGFPNLRFAHVYDPLALQESLAEFLTSLGRAPERGPMVAQQSVTMNLASEGGAPLATLPAELAGQEAADLFLVEKKGVTLRRGERGLYSLFHAEVPCRHVYQWKIPERDPQRPDPWNREREEKPPQEEIWHAVRLENDTPQPWTTAPASTTENGFLLGQDILHYTAAGASTLVRITRAVDVQGVRSESEVARESVVLHGSNYDRITVEGSLRATSYEREPITLEVERELAGEVAEVPPGGKRETLAEPLRDNPRTRLSWEFVLEPGATRELTYRYVLLVR